MLLKSVGIWTLAASLVSASQTPLVLEQDAHFLELKDYKVGDHSLLDFHKSLVEIPSVSFNEHNVGKYLAQYLEKAGLTVETHEIPGTSRLNVYGYYGSSRDAKVLLTSHIDTVPPFIPYFVNGTQIHGRGSCDAKGSVASQVFAVLSLIADGQVHHGDVALLFVVGEEFDGSGMEEASASLNATWDVAVFGEPTELKLGVGHKGAFEVELQATGLASHSGYPELGISASEILLPVLNSLLNTQWPHSDLLGPTTLNIGRVEIGVAANVVPATGNATIFIRVAQDLDKVRELALKQIEGVDHLSYNIPFEAVPQYLDYEVPGFETIVLAYSTDVPHMHIPLKKKYLYGPGSIHVAHGANEYIENQDLLDAIDGYKRLINYSL